MSTSNVTMQVQQVNSQVSVVNIQGEVTASAETMLLEAYSQASAGNIRTIILDFKKLKYMNSSGIGLLVNLLIQVKRQSQRLLAYGLNEHYRQIFELSRLSEAIGLYDTEADALAAANAA